ncbi:hypothetical protein PPERSA_04571 [Pseudocohnilembus persalinus]|uniref:Uncharacterized protein n=1 Tax=Pseudocohnilembus persalinus TaxID=266149 RepID=A0A0V0QEF1_PSEPJ|nr:hypothetical protein PPERSA_04571 [Pseudocohnilembus persalinus]|eukprot:KRX00550.1 hypothetical protein PPERSA_04571 [Pseudocohnilembus persalinus]
MFLINFKYFFSISFDRVIFFIQLMCKSILVFFQLFNKSNIRVNSRSRNLNKMEGLIISHFLIPHNICNNSGGRPRHALETVHQNISSFKILMYKLVNFLEIRRHIISREIVCFYYQMVINQFLRINQMGAAGDGKDCSYFVFLYDFF